MTPTNGTHLNPPQPTADPYAGKSHEELRAECGLIETKLELRRLKIAERLLESSAGLYGSNQWGSFVDPREAFKGEEEFRPAFSPLTLPTDRARGQNWPIYRDLPTLGRYRQASRVLSETNSGAIGLLKNIANYTVGTGFKYAVEARAGFDVDPQVPGDQLAPDVQEAIDAAQAVIDEFVGETEEVTGLTPWARRERETVWRVPADGEALLRWWGLEGGTSAVRVVEPECLIDPPGSSYTDGWSFGVRHRMQPFEDVETIEEYYVCQASDPAKGQKVPSSNDKDSPTCIFHVKDVDAKSTVKRGFPAFAFDTFDAFVRAATLQRNLSEGEALRAALAWIEQYDVATKSQVQSFADDKTDISRTDPITGRTQQIERWGPGTIARGPKGKQILPPPVNQGAAAQQQVVQGDLRQGLSAFCAPEYFTSDASNADYSSTKEAGAPWVKAADPQQQHFKGFFVSILWRVLRWAEKCNRLPAGTCDKIKLQVELPAILHKDPLIQAQVDQIYVPLGVKDRDSCSAELGYDPAVVQARNSEWDESHQPMGLPLSVPPDMGSGVDPGTGKPPAPPTGKLGESRDVARPLADVIKGALAEHLREWQPVVRYTESGPGSQPVINVYVPEIKIPEIKIPDINFPAFPAFPEPPAPIITVNVPEFKLPGPAPITVNVPEIKIPAAPDITVNVEPPVVTVNVPEPRPMKKTFKRNRDGDITDVIEEPAKE